MSASAKFGTNTGPADSTQPKPGVGGASVTDAVIVDLQQRRQYGVQKYGTELESHNGRDALLDAYQEALDLVMYLRQALMERGCGTGNLR